MKRKILVGAVLAFSLFLFTISASSQVLNEGTFKFGRTLSLIDAFYVDSANLDILTEKAIIEVLKNLDPHSTYISAKDVKEMNEPLNGNFEGIGVQFNLLRDSIIIVEPIGGGPSEKVGIRAGDRILTIDQEKVTGINISTNGVRSRLMGPKGTKVNITVYRKGSKDILDFTIIRDKIPILSVDASYMLDKETGYIKLNKFAATTEKEFSDAVANLKKNNMKNLVLDLRGNGGGYMLAATQLAENRHGRTLNLQAMEFFPHRGWLFLLMRGLHLQARFLPELFRIGTVELLWGDGHSGKDWYRTVFILLMVLC